MLYKFFIDDSGSKDYLTPYSKEFISNPPLFEKYENFWRDNYFVLCGVRISQEEIGIVNEDINSLKTKYFGTHKVEIKSDWLRNPHKRKKKYIDKFNVTLEDLEKFGEDLYDLISKHKDKLKLLAVVFDKRYYGDKKRQSADGNPLAKCSQILFERLQYLNTYHLVIFDQMESSLRIDKGNHGKILNVLRENAGMEKIYVTEYDKISDIKFVQSCNENFLQIADICAYNIYRQFVHYGREWDGKNKDKDGKSIMKKYKYFDKIRCNFIYMPKDKKVCGVGLVCLPDLDKCQWNLLDGCDT